MTRSIIIVGGGLLQLPAIAIAKELGLKTIVTDYDPNSPGLSMADVPAVISTRDVNGTVRVAKNLHPIHNIVGAITVGTDASTTVAAVAAALNLPGIKFQDAEAASNKIKMRERFREHNVPSPEFQAIWTLKDLKRAVNRIGFPCVLKPSDNMGARGVRRLDLKSDLEPSFHWAKEASPSGALIVEEYMEGPELSIDTVIYGGEIYFTGIADRIIEYAPYFVETGHTIPSSLPEEIINDAREVMTKGIHALGINIGAAKGDIKITSSGAKIGELAARLSGGFMSAYTYPYSSGIQPIKAAIQVAIGEEPGNLESEKNFVCVERAILDKPGIIESIEGLEEALKVPGVKNIFLTKDAGDESALPRSNIEKIGHIIAVGKTLAVAEKNSRSARGKLRIKIRPKISIEYSDIKKQAVLKFNKSCYVCKICDGLHCASGIPGMGGTGQMRTFQENTRALDRYFIKAKYLRKNVNPDLSISFLGQTFSLPVFAAPVTGTVTNMGGGIVEKDYIENLLAGTALSKTLAFLGDGSTPLKYKSGLEILEKNKTNAVQIFKPFEDISELTGRIIDAQKAGCLGWGIDIDAFHLRTMKKNNNRLAPKTIDDLKELKKVTTLPMILKGIISREDAEIALEAGADVIYLSNHGGRVLDGLPATVAILPEIIDVTRGRVPVLIDGGFRSGVHIFTALCLGATAVCVGRPIAIHNIGGGSEGVRLFFQNIAEELNEVLHITGAPDLASLGPEYVRIYD